MRNRGRERGKGGKALATPKSQIISRRAATIIFLEPIYKSDSGPRGRGKTPTKLRKTPKPSSS